MVSFTSEKKNYKFTRCERLLDLYGERLQEEPMYTPRKFRNDKNYGLIYFRKENILCKM